MSAPNNLALTSIKTNNPNSSIRKDEAGYYEFILGAVNSLNSCNEFYVKDGIEKFLTDENYMLARKLKNGYLNGEVGHPKFLPGMTRESYYARNLNVDIQNVSHHIKSVWTQESNIPCGVIGKGNKLLMKGMVKPSGVHGKVLQEHIDNNDANTAFSIRALTVNTQRAGVTYKSIVQIITWDWVLEPGIQQANKWANLSTESVDYLRFSVDDLTNKSSPIYKELMVALESEDSKQIMDETIYNIKRFNQYDIFRSW